MKAKAALPSQVLLAIESNAYCRWRTGQRKAGSQKGPAVRSYPTVIRRYLITPRGMTRFFEQHEQRARRRVLYRAKRRVGHGFHKSVPREGSRSLPQS